MTEHRVSRRVEASAEEVIHKSRYGYSKDTYINAINDTGEWKCSCGAGPFESEQGAKNHLSRN